MPNSSFTCPICNEPIEGSHTSCPRCGFKFVGATQTFNPVVTEVDGQVCEAESATPELEVLSGPYAGESFTLGNGTWVDGQIVDEAELKHGTHVQIGTFDMVFKRTK